MIYTTNAIESVNARLRKIIKTRGHFPSDDAATKLIWLALRNITADWSRAAHNWKAAMNQFAILYEDRFTKGFASYRDRLAHRVGRCLANAAHRGGQVSQHLTHRNSDTRRFQSSSATPRTRSKVSIEKTSWGEW